ncbi:MAG: S24/S26 family peptidase [Clostridia bacterium]
MVVNLEDMYPFMNEMLSAGKEIEITITGDSMFPTLHNRRDMVVLAKTEDFKRGDIVLYRRKTGQFVLHRIVRISDEDLFLVGDNQKDIESGITKADVIATVKEITRNKKHFSVTNKRYRLYSYIWLLIIPFRRYITHFMKK